MSRIGLVAGSLLIIPTFALAHCNSNPVTLEQIGWVLLAELGVVVIEAGLLRRFFKLTVLEAYSAALIANAVSFGLGVFLGLFLVNLDYVMIHDMSALFWNSDTRFMNRIYGDPILPTLCNLSSEFLRILYLSAILGGLAAAVEILVYPAQIRKHFEPDIKLNPLVFVLINLISYPFIYTAMFIFGWMVAWQH